MTTRTVQDLAITASDETARAFNSVNKRIKEVAGNTETIAKVSKVGFGLFLGGELLGAVRNLGKAMFDVSNATNKVDAQRLQGMHNSMEKAKASFLGVATIIGSKLAPILEMAANWFVQLIGDGEGFRKAIDRVFTWMVAGIGLVADAFAGWEMIWEGLKMAFYGFRLAVVSGLQGLDTILVDVANKIPGVHLQYSAGLAGAAEKAREALGAARLEFDEVMRKPLPSEMMKSAMAQFDQMKGAAVALTKEQEKARDAAAKALAKAKEQQDKEMDDLVNSSFEKVQKENEQLATSIEAMRKAGLSKLQVLEEQHAAEQASIQSARLRGITDEETARQLELESLARFNTQKEALQADADSKAQADRVKSFGQYQWMLQAETAFGEKSLKGRIAGTGILLGQAANLMQSSKKKEFEFGKKAAVANAFIGMGEGIGKAWGLPFPMNIAAVALVAAQSMMNIRQLQSQQFGGGGAANVGATASLSVDNTGQPAASAPSIQEAPMLPQSSQSGGPARQTVVKVDTGGNDFLGSWIRERLAPAMREAHGDGVVFMTV